MLLLAVFAVACGGPQGPPPETPEQEAARLRTDKIKQADDALGKNATTCFALYKKLSGDITKTSEELKGRTIASAEDLQSARQAWSDMDLKSKIPETCVTVAETDDADLKPTHDKHRETIEKNTRILHKGIASKQLATYVPLLEQALGAGLEVEAWPMLVELYGGGDLTGENPRRHELALMFAPPRDEALMKRFKKARGYGKLDKKSGEVMCLVSDAEFPADKKLKKVKAKIFSSHIEAAQVHVLCRLATKAKGLGEGMTAPKLQLQLLDAVSGEVLERVALGSPGDSGKSMYLRGSFAMPAAARATNVRGVYSVRAVVMEDGAADDAAQPVSEAAFTWRKP